MSSSKHASEPVTVAREYYNSSDADNFYYTIWGGEDIHVGLYRSDDEPIRDASKRTVERMAAHLTGAQGIRLTGSSKAIDIGAGYGGAARYLAKTFGLPVVALNLSEVENDRDREMNREQGLDQLVDVVDASFDDIPYDDDTFDVVWSQDAMLHSGDREAVLKEADRVLKRGGHFVFTDPMMADDCPKDVLQPILDRIHLDSLGSPGFYRRALVSLGYEEVAFEDHTHQLSKHYGRVLAETEKNESQLRKVVSQEYIDRMKKGLRHWVDGGNAGHLAWGIFHFKKTR